MDTNQPQLNKLWQPQDVDFIFRSYQAFEKKLSDIMKILPITKENEKSWSPELVNLFLDISSMIDSILRHIVGLRKDEKDRVQVKNNLGVLIEKEVRELDIDDFEINLFSDLQLFNSRVIVYVYPLRIISPYQNYRADDGWWKIYNLLKHNRIVNYNKANLATTLNALAALFLILVRYKGEEEFTKALMRFNFLETNYVPEIVHSERIGQGGYSFTFWYDSELFGTHEKLENIPSDDIAQVRHVTGSSKLQIFIGRFNP